MHPSPRYTVIRLCIKYPAESPASSFTLLVPLFPLTVFVSHSAIQSFTTHSGPFIRPFRVSKLIRAFLYSPHSAIRSIKTHSGLLYSIRPFRKLIRAFFIPFIRPFRIQTSFGFLYSIHSAFSIPVIRPFRFSKLIQTFLYSLRSAIPSIKTRSGLLYPPHSAIQSLKNHLGLYSVHSAVHSAIQSLETHSGFFILLIQPSRVPELVRAIPFAGTSSLYLFHSFRHSESQNSFAPSFRSFRHFWDRN
ncbi:hypothetical protein C8R43DRAFT_1024517 [Mycena crocata]|nr:hypothetical protein C8R43DRAFT_1024517 [Mycena crocata]